MHGHIIEFVKQHRDKMAGRVLEVGSYNVNGSVREVVDVTVGIDIRRGPGVDLVCSASNIDKHFEAGHFDACISTDALEHVADWKAFVRQTWAAVKEGGWLLITMASIYKGKHDYPHDYWRMTEEHIKAIYPGVSEVAGLGDKKPTSIGWVVQKRGELGDLDKIEPIKVQ